MPGDKKDSKKDGPPWYINMLYYPALITLLSGLVGAFLTELNTPPDFAIFVQPVGQTVCGKLIINPVNETALLADRGGVAYSNVKVESTSRLNRYSHPVYLYVNDSNCPAGVNISFKNYESSPDFNSTVVLKIDQTARIGKYSITIFGLGGDETQRHCILMLCIKPSEIDDQRPISSRTPIC
jgi:hypothetical protein